MIILGKEERKKEGVKETFSGYAAEMVLTLRLERWP